MIVLVAFALLALIGIVGTLRAVITDGHRRIPTDPRRAREAVAAEPAPARSSHRHVPEAADRTGVSSAARQLSSLRREVYAPRTR